MNKITLCGKEIKVNQREEKLTRIIKQDAERVLGYYHDNKFEKRVYERILNDIDGLLTAMFFMDLFENPVSVYDLELIKADEEFLEYMLGAGWRTIYE
jgi:hypothetical protein